MGVGECTLEKDIRTLAFPLSLFAFWLLKGELFMLRYTLPL